MRIGNYDIELVIPVEEVWSVDENGHANRVIATLNPEDARRKYQIVNSEGEVLASGFSFEGTKLYAEALAAGLPS